MDRKQPDYIQMKNMLNAYEYCVRNNLDEFTAFDKQNVAHFHNLCESTLENTCSVILQLKRKFNIKLPSTICNQLKIILKNGLEVKPAVRDACTNTEPEMFASSTEAKKSEVVNMASYNLKDCRVILTKLESDAVNSQIVKVTNKLDNRQIVEDCNDIEILSPMFKRMSAIWNRLTIVMKNDLECKLAVSKICTNKETEIFESSTEVEKTDVVYTSPYNLKDCQVILTKLNTVAVSSQNVNVDNKTENCSDIKKNISSPFKRTLRKRINQKKVALVQRRSSRRRNFFHSG
ncbi:uncharacterized protein LOC126846892 [Adelges cooleyi]|uniref:uncharacterized protein LOC126846892 n=1 Tax=Adelges cooleyi TaxID=133065 RepID=UPI002180771B|nr:uncharacterized protein LOC126846892 [Adelges cooleyi]XP_050442699.1 uncharacterized protein LOC126846892 [Adelges cooleyi]XP_050442700.1 uncharacterized protein LOC126846892 [Adelges cooleyi]